jgi:hypothetical protein
MRCSGVVLRIVLVQKESRVIVHHAALGWFGW